MPRGACCRHRTRNHPAPPGRKCNFSGFVHKLNFGSFGPTRAPNGTRCATHSALLCSPVSSRGAPPRPRPPFPRPCTTNKRQNHIEKDPPPPPDYAAATTPCGGLVQLWCSAPLLILELYLLHWVLCCTLHLALSVNCCAPHAPASILILK